MVKIYTLLLLIVPFISRAQRGDFSLNDLVKISSISPRQMDSYLNRRGFSSINESKSERNSSLMYLEKAGKNEPDTSRFRAVEVFKSENEDYCLKFSTCSETEFLSGCEWLKHSGFVYEELPVSTEPQLFRKSNMIVEASANSEDGRTIYNFLLKKKQLPPPSSVQFAEDLTQFDSHEFLAAYFGEANVKKDVFYFSEKELQKCSVLFPNTSRQAVFIWENEQTLSEISFVLISGLLPTLSAVEYSGNISQNTWTLKNGISTGMRIKELLALNGADFNFYGKNSEFAYMVEPMKTGALDFTKAGVMLSSFDQHSPLLSKQKISAAEAVQQGLSIYVTYVMVGK